jgi:hypothetical protein
MNEMSEVGPVRLLVAGLRRGDRSASAAGGEVAQRR